MKHDQWLNDLRKRMEDYSEPVPADLWSELEEELNHQDHPRVVPFWRRWQTVAAAVVLVAAFSSLWFIPQSSSDSSQMTADIPQIKQNVEELESSPSVSSLEKTFPTKEQVSLAVQSSHTKVRIKPSVVAQQLPIQLKDEDKNVFIITEAKDEGESEALMTEEKDEETSNKEKTSVVEQKPVRKDYPSSQTQPSSFHPSKNKKGWEIDLCTGGGQMESGIANNYSYLVSPIMYSKVSKDYNSQSEAVYYDLNAGGSNIGYPGDAYYSAASINNQVNVSNVEYKHKTPITIGMSVRLFLDKNWALETGLMYTQLSSDLQSKSNSYFKQEQTLHYVGIPLKLNRTLWENKRFDIYASAGGAVEKSVSGKIQTIISNKNDNSIENSVDLDIDRLQWSVNGGVGAQLHLTDKFGAYIEPGINYYFDDGTNVETIRKEHPLNLNLRLGLRLSLDR